MYLSSDPLSGCPAVRLTNLFFLDRRGCPSCKDLQGRGYDLKFKLDHYRAGREMKFGVASSMLLSIFSDVIHATPLEKEER